MIPITVEKKKYNIKAIWELTTSEFIALSQIEDLTTIRYIAWQCSLDEATLFYSKISKSVEVAIGVAPDVTRLEPCKDFDLRKDIDTLGQRHQIENSNKKGFELLVFTLAVSQARSNNIDDVLKLYAEYMQKDFYKVLPTGFFFLNRFNHGSRPVRNFLRMLPGWKKILS